MFVMLHMPRHADNAVILACAMLPSAQVAARYAFVSTAICTMVTLTPCVKKQEREITLLSQKTGISK